MKKIVPLLIILIVVGLAILLIRQNPPETGKKIVPTGSIQEDQDSSAKTEKTVSPDTNEGIVLEITSPVDQSIVDTTPVTVKGKTAPSADVFINEKELKADGLGNFNSVITLEEGDNYIIIAANDVDGNYAEKEIVVTFEMP